MSISSRSIAAGVGAIHGFQRREPQRARGRGSGSGRRRPAARRARGRAAARRGSAARWRARAGRAARRRRSGCRRRRRAAGRAARAGSKRSGSGKRAGSRFAAASRQPTVSPRRKRWPKSSTSSSAKRVKRWSGGSKRSTSSTVAAVASGVGEERGGVEAGGEDRRDAVADRVHRRLVAGVEQQHAGGDELVGVEPVAGGLGGDQLGDQVVGRAAAPRASTWSREEGGEVAGGGVGARPRRRGRGGPGTSRPWRATRRAGRRRRPRARRAAGR